MLDTIRRMFADNRPIDNVMLVVELLVLLLIAYEVWIGILERRKERKRKNDVREKVSALRNAMFEGQKIQHSWPKIGGSRAECEAALNSWFEQTTKLLRSYSAHAETAFLCEVPEPPNKYGSIEAVFHYSRLMQRITNLQGIIEKPDVYL
jgi:hypothetical protein